MDWHEEYRRKLVSPEEAVKVVRSGDRVAFSNLGLEPLALGLALAARKDELKGVKVLVPSPGRDFGWYDPGWEESFEIIVGYILPIVRDMAAERRCDYSVSSLVFTHDSEERVGADVLLTELSPPDAHGYCSFGASLWHKKTDVKNAKVVLAEVNKSLIRTYGDNFVHVSEIDYFVEHTPTGKTPGSTDLLGRREIGPDETEKRIAELVSALIKDGDTLQIGVGGTSEFLAQLGTFDNKVDLGWHSETTPRGIIPLVREGVINGKRKTIHTGKVVATAIGGGTKEDMDFVDENPMFELYSADYVLDPRTISAHDNMVALNNAIAVDLTGQIAAESLGSRMVSGAGGQTTFAIGARLSRGGRSITALRSTATGGKVSRIVPHFEPGTIITVPRNISDIVVTEYGIARLRGKTQRERADELIAVAHPDFRAKLRKKAERLFWP